jgi:hypothetical protein
MARHEPLPGEVGQGPRSLTGTPEELAERSVVCAALP